MTMLRKIARASCIVLLLFIIAGCKKNNPEPDKEPDTQEPIDETPWTPYTMRNKRELFVDQYLIQSKSKVEHRLHHPVSAGPVLYFDRPWEGNFSTYVSVVQAEGLYHMYYRGSGGTGTNGQVTCYAVSNDGINWSKPNLALHSVNGTMNNNIVLIFSDIQTSHNFAAFYDTKEGVDPSERFKGVGGVASNPSRPNRGLYRYVSSNGVNWTQKSTTPLFDNTGTAMDSQNVLTWLPDEQRYAIYLRTWTGDSPGHNTLLKGTRTIARSTSTDFVNWTAPERMTFGDTPMEDLYTNATQPYFRAPHILVAMPFRFAPTVKVLSDEELIQYGVHNSMWVGASDAVFMTSRGGNSYDRTFMQSFIRPGLNGNNWAARSNIPASGIAQTGPDELSIYLTRAYATDDVYLERMTLRLDGFASVRANFEEGHIITKPLILEGSHLNVNYSTSSVGYVKVSFLDENGQEIDGYRTNQVKSLIGDKTDERVTWNLSSSISRINGRPVRIKFTIKDADVYSFSVWD